VDLSKLEISIYDKAGVFKKQSNTSSQKRIWIFGGSTTDGYACESRQSSSWPDEISKINKNFDYKNFAFGGANSDQQISILLKEIVKYSPKIILWANKFNVTNVLGHSDYRNKNILKYDFSDAKKNKFLLNIKRVDKTLKSYLLSYALLDKVIFRIKVKLINENVFDRIEINPSKEDLINAVKNFEINTNEAINVSKKFGVSEFYLVSLLSSDNFSNEKKYQLLLYNDTIRKIEKKFYPFVKIIDTDEIFEKDLQNIFLCDEMHKTYKGNIYQANIINKKLKLLSNILQ